MIPDEIRKHCSHLENSTWVKGYFCNFKLMLIKSAKNVLIKKKAPPPPPPPKKRNLYRKMKLLLRINRLCKKTRARLHLRRKGIVSFRHAKGNSYLYNPFLKDLFFHRYKNIHYRCMSASSDKGHGIQFLLSSGQ